MAGLPNEIISWADRIAAAQREASAGARNEAIQYEQRRLFGELGPVIAIGAVAVLIYAIAK